jgi:hypothetical protein
MEEKMKTCENMECFWARTAKRIMTESKGKGQVASMIKRRGVCDETKCKAWRGE